MKSFALRAAFFSACGLLTAGCLPRTVKFVPGDAATDTVVNNTDVTVDAGPPPAHARCSRTFPTDLLSSAARFQQHIVIGTIFSYVDNIDTLQSAELAIRQANATAGLNGKPFGIVHCDYAPTLMTGDMLNDIDATTAVTHYLIDQLHVPAIIGPRGSPRAIAAWAVAKDTGTLLISPSATSTTLTALDNTAPTDAVPGFFWRTVPVDTLQAQAAVEDMRRRGITNVAVIYDNGSYGMTFSDTFFRAFTATSGNTAQLYSFTTGMLGTVPMTVAGNTNAQEVLFIASNLSDHTAFLNAVSADTTTLLPYYRSRGIFFSAVGYSDTLLTNANANYQMLLPKIRGARPAVSSTSLLFMQFAQDYQSQFLQSVGTTTFSVNSYDAAWLVLYGAAWSQSHTTSGAITGLGIAQGLRKVSMGTATDIRPSNWPAVQNAFRQNQSIDVNGASGPLNYDPMTEETTAPIEVWKIDIPSGMAPRFAADFTINP